MCLPAYVAQEMQVCLQRVLGLLRLGRHKEAVETASDAKREVEQTPLSPSSVAARLAAAGAKCKGGRNTAADALDELSALKVLQLLLCPPWRTVP